MGFDQRCHPEICATWSDDPDLDSGFWSGYVWRIDGYDPGIWIADDHDRDLVTLIVYACDDVGDDPEIWIWIVIDVDDACLVTVIFFFDVALLPLFL